MKLDRIDVFIVAAFFLAGSVVGGVLVFQQLDSRMNTLEKKFDSSNTVNIVHSNETSEEVVVDLFQEVRDSVVSVQGVGNESSSGSGFVYSREGHIVTNEHVVEGNERLEVTFTDGKKYNARVVGTDAHTDLAVLKVNRRKLEPLEVGDSKEVETGQTAIAIGNPFGLRGTMTKGIISAKGRLLPAEGGFSIPNVLQTDAAINPGNSGGPLMNLRGQVIGVNTAIQTNTGTFSGVGFAIPANTVDRVVPELIEKGDVEHPWIGVRGIDVSPEIADRMDLENATGFLVLEVVEDSPADRAGLRAGNSTEIIDGREIDLGGDVIVGLAGEKMGGINDILPKLAKDTSVNQTVNITVIREGEEVTLPLKLGSRPND